MRPSGRRTRTAPCVALAAAAPPPARCAVSFSRMARVMSICARATRAAPSGPCPERPVRRSRFLEAHGLCSRGIRAVTPGDKVSARASVQCIPATHRHMHISDTRAGEERRPPSPVRAGAARRAPPPARPPRSAERWSRPPHRRPRSPAPAAAPAPRPRRLHSAAPAVSLWEHALHRCTSADRGALGNATGTLPPHEAVVSMHSRIACPAQPRLLHRKRAMNRCGQEKPCLAKREALAADVAWASTCCMCSKSHPAEPRARACVLRGRGCAESAAAPPAAAPFASSPDAGRSAARSPHGAGLARGGEGKGWCGATGAGGASSCSAWRSGARSASDGSSANASVGGSGEGASAAAAPERSGTPEPSGTPGAAGAGAPCGAAASSNTSWKPHACTPSTAGAAAVRTSVSQHAWRHPCARRA